MISLTIKILTILMFFSCLLVVPQYQIFAVIGTQTDDTLVDGVNDLIRCLGNSFSPTICKGTNHDDKIISSGVGYQTIYGLDGDDLIQGDVQSDVIYAGDGDDIVSGGEGTDSVFGNDGKDILYGDSGSSAVYGGGGNFLYGGKGDDKLYGGADNDVLTGGSGHDSFDCGEGADTVTDFDPDEDTAFGNCENLE